MNEKLLIDIIGTTNKRDSNILSNGISLLDIKRFT